MEERWTTDEFLALLPSQFDNRLVNYKNESNLFEVYVRSNFSSLAEAIDWRETFEQNSKTKFISQRSKSRPIYHQLSKDYICHHSDRNKDIKSDDPRRDERIHKATGCQAQLNFRVKLNTPITRRRDPLIKQGILGVVHLKHWHNHALVVKLSHRQSRRMRSSGGADPVDGGAGVVVCSPARVGVAARASTVDETIDDVVNLPATMKTPPSKTPPAPVPTPVCPTTMGTRKCDVIKSPSGHAAKEPAGQQHHHHHHHHHHRLLKELPSPSITSGVSDVSDVDVDDDEDFGARGRSTAKRMRLGTPNQAWWAARSPPSSWPKPTTAPPTIAIDVDHLDVSAEDVAAVSSQRRYTTCGVDNKTSEFQRLAGRPVACADIRQPPKRSSTDTVHAARTAMADVLYQEELLRAKAIRREQRRQTHPHRRSSVLVGVRAPADVSERSSKSVAEQCLPTTLETPAARAPFDLSPRALAASAAAPETTSTPPAHYQRPQPPPPLPLGHRGMMRPLFGQKLPTIPASALQASAAAIRPATATPLASAAADTRLSIRRLPAAAARDYRAQLAAYDSLLAQRAAQLPPQQRAAAFTADQQQAVAAAAAAAAAVGTSSELAQRLSGCSAASAIPQPPQTPVDEMRNHSFPSLMDITSVTSRSATAALYPDSFWRTATSLGLFDELSMALHAQLSQSLEQLRHWLRETPTPAFAPTGYWMPPAPASEASAISRVADSLGIMNQFTRRVDQELVHQRPASFMYPNDRTSTLLLDALQRQQTNIGGQGSDLTPLFTIAQTLAINDGLLGAFGHQLPPVPWGGCMEPQPPPFVGGGAGVHSLLRDVFLAQ